MSTAAVLSGWLSLLLLLVALLILFWVVGARTRLRGLRARVGAKLVILETQLQQRHLLVPALIERAGTAFRPRPALLAALQQALAQAISAHAEAVADPGQMLALRRMMLADAELTAALASLRVLCAAPASRQASVLLWPLLDDLASAEQHTLLAQHAYNDSVMRYNGALAQFPSVVIVRLFAFKAAAVLRVPSN